MGQASLDIEQVQDEIKSKRTVFLLIYVEHLMCWDDTIYLLAFEDQPDHLACVLSSLSLARLVCGRSVPPAPRAIYGGIISVCLNGGLLDEALGVYPQPCG